jgi:hypothetical protein
MRRRRGLLVLPPIILILALVGPSPADAAEGGSAVACTQSATTTTTTPAGVEGAPVSPPANPSPGTPCWVDVNPYPFGSEGAPVQTPTPSCGLVFNGQAPGSQCALTVTSLAFRAWNRGLAATDTSEALTKNPYGVWLYNGSSWVPSPGFPGNGTCPGHTVVWAGKLDYWLIGGPGDTNWSRLCRFDGSALEWESLELPAATKQRVSYLVGTEERRRPGGITSAACLAWNNCWFFGTYGVVLHWGPHEVGGRQVLSLSDASPELSQLPLLGEYTAAIARPDLQGNVFGVAVSATAQRALESPSQILPSYEGGPPPEMWTSNGGPFSPDPFTPPTSPQENDPYRTDLVAVDFDSAGEGWVAGNPAGLRVSSPGTEARPASPNTPPPSPLVPVSTSGASTTCFPGPPSSRFTYTPPAFNDPDPPNSFMWSSIAAIPNLDEALAGGRLVPKKASAVGSDPNEAPAAEPAIVQAACDGTTSVTRFRVEDPTYHGSSTSKVPADREGYVNAIAANATNDAWAATTPGSLTEESGSVSSSEPQPPHLYRLTDGLTPQAPEGNDLEERPLELQLDAPTIVLEPPLPLPPEPAPTTVTQTHTVKLPSAIFDVKAKLHKGKHGLTLYLSFRVRRPVTLGAQALRHGHIVSEARPRLFTGRHGLLILKLNRKHWPTKVRLVA